MAWYKFSSKTQEPEKEERSTQNDVNEVSSENNAFSLDSLLVTDEVTEEKVMSIPTARSCVDLISGSIAQMPVYLYKEDKKGNIEKVNDKRVNLLNHQANDFLNGYALKKHMVKDYLLHGASYVSIVETGDKIELHPLKASAVVVKKRVKYGYKTVGADIVLSNTEHNAINDVGRQQTKFKPHELMITLQDTNDGLTSAGVIKHGQDIFRQALSEMEYTQNLYENGALPLGLLKTDARLNEKQAGALRAAWQKLYGGVKNAAKTVVLQEGMTYQPLSMNPSEIQMTETRKGTNTEICKLFNISESMISTTAGKQQHVSIEQTNTQYLKTTLSTIIASMESSMDRALLLEKEKEEGYFFRFDTSELVRATEKERIESVVIGVQGGLFTINEGRSKFDLPAIENGDNVLITPGAMQAGDQTNNDEPVEQVQEKVEESDDKTRAETS
ncbi:phage portal protein [Bacillus cereus group sp. TH153LC]|uniref:phage portal protein n=1 Tax=Bacillus cereus group sp. TH153LC TaxID=3018059 RepID=UPI0022DEFDBF|nr:phage portal protein [Bacillus cereus group sp. TH153LC]MDA1660383.1 phage portal protein [Bacillus cereus group sp. TH153LC]